MPAQPQRTYGRVPVDPDGNVIPVNEFGLLKWVEVDPDPNGLLDGLYITTLAQCLRLNLGEDPFYAKFGIPQLQTVLTQIYPDYYVQRMQRYFAQFFASLIIYRQIVESDNRPVPTYGVSIVTQSGFEYAFTIVPPS